MKYLLLLLLLLSSITNASIKCDKFKLFAEEVMDARQHGFKVQQEPSNRLERRMVINVWNWPQYHAEYKKALEVEYFAQHWATICERGWYK